MLKCIKRIVAAEKKDNWGEKMIKECEENVVLQEDMEELVNSGCLFDDLKGNTVFVTGATGLIGSQIVKALACANRLKDSHIRILAFVRSEEKARKVFGSLLDRGDVSLVFGDVNREIETGENVDYVIHGASATSSRFFVTNPVETILTALEGTKNILEGITTRFRDIKDWGKWMRTSCGKRLWTRNRGFFSV